MDIPTYHADAGRSGLNPNFQIDNSEWTRYVMLPTSYPVRAAPLYLAQYTFTTGPHANETHDVVIVAASDNQVYAYAEDQLLAGIVSPLWVQSLGVASTRAGNFPVPIPPNHMAGICGTPVLDRSSALVYVVALVNDRPVLNPGLGGAQFRVFNTIQGVMVEPLGEVYKIFALALDTGDIVDHAVLHDPGSPGRPTFDPMAHDQRGGLNLVNGWIYATFADFLTDDEGPYHGWIVACDQFNLTRQLFLPLTTLNITGGGIWGPGGAAAAPDGTLFASTGNGVVPDGYWSNLHGGFPAEHGDFFEGVVRVAIRERPLVSKEAVRKKALRGNQLRVVGSAKWVALEVVDWYQPGWVKALNDNDLDLGGSSPMVLSLPHRNLVITTAKDGNVYLLDGKLGGGGAELWSSVTDPANPTDGAVFVGSDVAGSKCAPAFFNHLGDQFVYVVGAGDSEKRISGLVAYRVDPSNFSLSLTWKSGLAFGNYAGSPFVTADPTTQKGLVWTVDGSDGDPAVLRAFDAVTGQLAFHSDAVPGNEVGQCPHFAPITGAGRSIFVGTNTGVIGYSQTSARAG